MERFWMNKINKYVKTQMAQFMEQYEDFLHKRWPFYGLSFEGKQRKKIWG